MSCSSTGDGGNLCQLASWNRASILKTSEPVELASPGNLLEMQILRPQNYWVLNSGGGPCNLCFHMPSSWFRCLLKFENHEPRAVIRKLWCTLVSPGECLKLPKLRPQPRPIKSESPGVDEVMSVSGFKSQIRHFQEDIVRRHFKQREDSTKVQKHEQLCIVNVKAAVLLKHRVWKQSKGRMNWSSGPARRQSTDSYDLENE